MLTENKNCTASNFGVKRKVTANFRGMTDEEVKEFERDRDLQTKEHTVRFIVYIIRNTKILKKKNFQKQLIEAKVHDEEWAQLTNNFARFTILKERECDRKKKYIHFCTIICFY